MIPDRELPNFSGLKLLSAQILISLFGFGSMLRQRTDLEPATYAVRSIGRYQEYQEEVGPRSEVKKTEIINLQSQAAMSYANSPPIFSKLEPPRGRYFSAILLLL